MKERAIVLIGTILLLSICGCFSMRKSEGGGQTRFITPRTFDPADVAVPPGYTIELVTSGLTFPTGVAFDDAGRPFVIEAGYSYGEVWTTPRLLRVESDGGHTPVAEGGKNGPWTGIAYHRNAFFIAEGGELEGGRIIKVSPDGAMDILVRDLPSRGDHHTNGPAIGPDGALYFSIGTYTNSAVVGEDNVQFGWAKRYPNLHDIPCEDVTVAGRNFTIKNPFADEPKELKTGAFSPLGTPTSAGQVIPGFVPCSGCVLRISPEGGTPELVAWGFRNPFGLAFSPDGRLYLTENQYDERGSRPIFGAGDLLWLVTPGAWYGWPDFHGDTPLNEGDRYRGTGDEKPALLLSRHPQTPPKPVAIFPVHSSSDGLDFSTSARFGYVGEAFVAQFGDQSPTTGKSLSPVGFKVVRADVRSGIVSDFAVNKGKTNGPASWLRSSGLERPVAVKFNPQGDALYVVDFGVLLQSEEGANPVKGTGALWKITRQE